VVNGLFSFTPGLFNEPTLGGRLIAPKVWLHWDVECKLGFGVSDTNGLVHRVSAKSEYIWGFFHYLAVLESQH
jgi:hypothetical protein